MPIYEFNCAKCKKTFESLVMKKADERGVKCPTCGNKKVTRVLSSHKHAPHFRRDSGGTYSPK
jgi:putative FmdB family regulatory protein